MSSKGQIEMSSFKKPHYVNQPKAGTSSSTYIPPTATNDGYVSQPLTPISHHGYVNTPVAATRSTSVVNHGYVNHPAVAKPRPVGHSGYVNQLVATTANGGYITTNTTNNSGYVNARTTAAPNSESGYVAPSFPPSPTIPPHRNQSEGQGQTPGQSQPNGRGDTAIVTVEEDAAGEQIEEEADPNYWKFTICGTSLPFTIIGLPTHLIFGKFQCRVNLNNRACNSRTAIWLRSVFDPTDQKCFAILLSILTLIISAGFGIFVFQALATVFFHLVILGDVPSVVLSSTLTFFRFAPAVIPVILTWIRGYTVRDLINSFDGVGRELKERLKWDVDEDKRRLYPKLLVRSCKNARVLLMQMYIATLLSHMIYWAAQTVGKSMSPWVNNGIDIMYSFVLPLYCSFCWAIGSSLETLAEHLQHFQMTERRPTFQVMTDIKFSFKKIIGLVYKVNDVFRIFMSWVIPVLLISIVIKLLFAAMYIFGYATLKNILATGLGLEIDEAKNGTANSTTTDPDDLIHAPALVRAAVGYLFVATVHLFLLAFTIWQAVKVNDQTRYIHVLLNDYMVQVSGKVAPEIYESYRMLKFYMHSTMEQENSALLRLPILGCFACFPQLSNRLQGYHLRS